MSSQGRALLWKEWREWRTTLFASNLVVLLSLAIAAYCERWTPHTWALDSVAIALYAFAQVAAIFLAIRVSERGADVGVTCFLSSLPVSSWSATLVQLATGALLLTLPFLTLTVLDTMTFMAMEWNWIQHSQRTMFGDQSLLTLVTVRVLARGVIGSSVTIIYITLSVIGLLVRHHAYVGQIGACLVIVSALLGVTGFAVGVIGLPITAVIVLPWGIMTPGIEASGATLAIAIVSSLLLQAFAGIAVIVLSTRRTDWFSQGIRSTAR